MKMEIVEIELSKIKLNPTQPRKEFNKEKLKELAESIKNLNLINPINVKKISENKYELICGERRLKAHKLLKRKTISAIIKKYNSKEKEMEESLVENLHRTDLTSIERENFIYNLWKTKKYETKKELGKKIGLSNGIIISNLIAKKLRKELQINKNISTRTIKQVLGLENIDKKKVLEKVNKGEIKTDKVRAVSNILKQCQEEIKNSYFKNEISIEQANKISKIKEKKLREKMILAHKNIKAIDKSIEKNFENIKPKKENTIKIKEKIQTFRTNSLKTQKLTQRTIKSLMNCIPLISLMDNKQLKKLKHFQELLKINLSNSVSLINKFQTEILTQE